MLYPKKTLRMLGRLGDKGLRRMRGTARVLFAVTPVLVAVVMVVHCVLLMCGMKLLLVSFAFGHGLYYFVLTFMLSYCYDYSALHRLFCIYDYVVSGCIWWQDKVGFGIILPAVRVLVIALGVAAIAVTYRRYGRFIMGLVWCKAVKACEALRRAAASVLPII